MMEKRFQWLYAASLAISGAILGQMLLYALQYIFKWKTFYNIFDLCVILFKDLHVPAPIAWHVVNALILYSFSAILWISAQHFLGSIKAMKLVEMYQDPHLSEQYRDKFQLGEGQFQIISYKAPIAMTIGLWKPRMILSSGLMDMLDPNELRAVIEHEKCHMRHRDPLAIFLLSMISKSMWYIPIFAWMADKYPIMIELRADKFAIAQMEQSTHLGSALLKLLKQAPTPHVSLSHASFAEISMNVRIMHILDPQRKISFKWPHVRLLISLLTIILLVGLI
ncbi:M56 family metallopeptidase [Paenibacillus andongensis]|uniref:M56 family metallopeptidase n=1 Tax=Paenibacillus andongensis TaxID=2975482 RepID=UPI0021BB1CAB|nr:M56 family metallopeptidase [Paenibacillus andongensis]